MIGAVTVTTTVHAVGVAVTVTTKSKTQIWAFETEKMFNTRAKFVEIQLQVNTKIIMY